LGRIDGRRAFRRRLILEGGYAGHDLVAFAFRCRATAADKAK